eukprot:Clim_evm1s94 gene=Clim_evmTU1s94
MVKFIFAIAAAGLVDMINGAPLGSSDTDQHLPDATKDGVEKTEYVELGNGADEPKPIIAQAPAAEVNLGNLGCMTTSKHLCEMVCVEVGGCTEESNGCWNCK